MGFLNLLKKVLPQFAAAEQIIKAAKEGGAKGAAVAIVTALMKGAGGSPLKDANLALAASVDDHQADIIELKRRVRSLEEKADQK